MSLLVRGVTRFTGLHDVPGSYGGAGRLMVSVKETEDGLEFVKVPAGAAAGYAERLPAGEYAKLADYFGQWAYGHGLMITDTIHLAVKGNNTNSVFAFNLATLGSAFALPAFPVTVAGRNTQAGLYLNRYVYSSGDPLAGGAERYSFRAFDLHLNSWSSRAPLPRTANGFPVDLEWANDAVIVFDSRFQKIYAFGCRRSDSGDYLGTACYDCATDIWTIKANAPRPIYSTHGLRVGDRIYLDYFQTPGSVNSGFGCYDIASDSYHDLADYGPNAPVLFGPMFWFADRPDAIYLLHGKTGFTAGISLSVYSISGNSWTRLGYASDTPISARGVGAFTTPNRHIVYRRDTSSQHYVYRLD